jgi:MFS transporter, DHA2 family, metal-tetracycline-proton antiporter
MKAECLAGRGGGAEDGHGTCPEVEEATFSVWRHNGYVVDAFVGTEPAKACILPPFCLHFRFSIAHRLMKAPTQTADPAPDMKLFWACFIALVATSFVFGVRSTLIGEIARDFKLSQGDVGRILGVGLWPFALSIIVFSLIIDRIGYKAAALFAIVCHFLAIGLTLMAKPDNDLLYWGTFTVALANGTVEALINPVVATLFKKDKSKWLNILHAGWPAGIALGSIFTLMLGEGISWQIKFGVCLLPVIIYTLLILPRQFPVNERVAAGVSYREMLAEFGAFGFFMFTVLCAMAVYQAGGSEANWIVVFGIGALVAIAAGAYTRSLGRPMFILILITMPFLATTELGTDTWMPDLLSLELGKAAAWILVYTSIIMTILRSFAGPVVHKFSPIGLLVLSAAVAIVGLLLLQGATGWAIVAVATLYAFGKTFLWSTTLGLVSEQFPRGGALSLNGVSAIGVLGMGVIGAPLMGIWQDTDIDKTLRAQHPAIHERVKGPNAVNLVGTAPSVDAAAVAQLPEAEQTIVTTIQNEFKKKTFARTALLPGFLLLCYLLLFFYFRSKGGYKPIALSDH